MKTLAILTCLLLAGCASPDASSPAATHAEPSRAPSSADPNATEAAVAGTPGGQPSVEWAGDTCDQTHGFFAVDPVVYATEIPEGFTLWLSDGDAYIATLSLSCANGSFHVPFVLVEPPVSRAVPDAVHGFIVEEAWIDGDGLVRVLEAAAVPWEGRQIAYGSAGAAVATILSLPDLALVFTKNASVQGFRLDPSLVLFAGRWDEAAGVIRATPNVSMEVSFEETTYWDADVSRSYVPVLGGVLEPNRATGVGHVAWDWTSVTMRSRAA